MKGTHTYIVAVLVCFGLTNTAIAENLYKVKNSLRVNWSIKKLKNSMIKRPPTCEKCRMGS